MDDSNQKGGAFTRLLVRLAILPIAIFVAYLDMRSEGSMGRAIFDFFRILGEAFLYLLAIVSLVVAGVAASGRLKSGPDAANEDRKSGPQISPRTFLVGMAYVALFGVMYFSQVELGGFSLTRFSGLTNALLFAMPIWTLICVARYKTELRKSASSR